MPSIQKSSLYSFNRGIISALALARVDIKRAAIAAAIQQNYWPRVLGPMMLRPGLQRIGQTSGNALSKLVPFVKATTDTALLEITSSFAMYVWINDSLVTVPAVGTQTTNSLFIVNITGWTVNDEAGASSVWEAGSYLKQSSTNGSASAIVDQLVSVAGADQNKEHLLEVGVNRGPVTLAIGTGTTDDSYVNETVLETGQYVFSFTPTGNFNVRFKNSNRRSTRVSACIVRNFPSSATLSVTSPWAASDFDNLRFEQSADVIFVACRGQIQHRIERRGVHSWGIVEYKSPDGPFRAQNTSYTTITPTALDGDVTLSSSKPIFRPTHVNSLWRLKSAGQTVSQTITAADQWTNPIQITGVGPARGFFANITGVDPTTGAIGSIVRLQISFGVTGNWSDTGHVFTTWNTSGQSVAFQDANDNQIVFLRFGVKAGDYTSRTPTLTLTAASGSITGIARVISYTSRTAVDVQVLKPLGGTSAVTLWSEGQWSDFRGWPSSVALHEGRLWWAGLTFNWGSVSDAYDSFDDTLVGDAGPIARTIGSGPVDTVEWILSLQRMILGTQGAQFSVRASAVDDVITPANYNVKKISQQGSATVQAVAVDQSGIFINRTGRRAYQLDFGFQFYDYSAKDLTALCPSVLSPGVVRMAVQRQPDTRVHFILSDGTAVMCVMDPVEEVNAFVTTVTDGLIKDVAVLPALTGNSDDQVYYLVFRNGNYLIEKFAQESEAQGGTLNKIADSFVVYQGAPATVITGLSHLNGKQVVVWADGQDVGTDDSVVPWTQRYTVSAGQITLAVAASTVIVGLGYTAKFQSVKLGLASGPGSPLNTSKRITELGLILANTHVKGVQFGQEFTHLDDMPGVEQGRILTPSVTGTYDEQPIAFPGVWSSDMRVCLQSIAPRPCTVLALTPTLVET